MATLSQRLQSGIDIPKVRHLRVVLKLLQKEAGHAGWDFDRDERTRTVEALIKHVLATYAVDAIDRAHETAKAQYPNLPRRGAGAAATAHPLYTDANGKPKPPVQELISSMSAPTTDQFNSALSPYDTMPIYRVTWEPMTSGMDNKSSACTLREVFGYDLRHAKDATELGGGHAMTSHSAAADAVRRLEAVGFRVHLRAPNVAPPMLQATQAAPTPVAAAVTGNALVDSLAGLLNMLIEQQLAPMRAEMHRVAMQAAAQAAALASGAPTLVKIETPQLGTIDLGVQHFNFPLLVKMANARLRNGSRLNIWLYGPRGVGKTHAGGSLAQALFSDRPAADRFRYNGAIATKYELSGFIDAQGRIISPAFRQAWEHGGVYLFDEIDASMPEALLAFNGALSGTVASFPDKMVDRHPDCVIIAGANTTGMGGTMEYTARFKQDAAFIDRFVFLDWPLDEKLEQALCGDAAWLATVRRARERAKAAGLKGNIPSPRATLYGEALKAAGLTEGEARDAVLRKGMPNDQWSQMGL